MSGFIHWTDIARRDHSRADGRYPRNLTENEWARIAAFLPPAGSGGRPRTTDLRDVMNAGLYLATVGCSWRMRPKDFPLRHRPVQGYFYDWRNMGLVKTIPHLQVMDTRDLEGREAGPTAGVIDNQSVKATESGGIPGHNAGKKIKGRKRHVLTDRLGLLLFVAVHAAGIQDRENPSKAPPRGS